MQDDNFSDKYRDNPTVGVFSRLKFNPVVRHVAEENNYIDEMIGREKYASLTDTSIDMPGPIGPMDSSDSYPTERPTDLHQEGFERPKPSPKDLIKARIAKIQKGYENEAIAKRQEQDDVQFAANQSASTDISVDRKGLEPTTTYLTKTSSNPLSLLEDEDINPIKVMLLMNEKWQEEWFDWEPETIIQTLYMEGISIGNINLSKIFAIRTVLKTNEFFEDPRTFEKVVIAFSGRIVDWGCVQEVSVSEMNAVVALIERYLKEHDFSNEVSMYVAGRATTEGFVKLPTSLHFATGNLNYIIAVSMGDAKALELIDKLNESLESKTDDPPPEVAVQYLRLARCEYKSQELIEQARK